MIGTWFTFVNVTLADNKTWAINSNYHVKTSFSSYCFIKKILIMNTHTFWICLFGVCRPTRDFFTYMHEEASPLHVPYEGL